MTNMQKLKICYNVLVVIIAKIQPLVLINMSWNVVQESIVGEVLNTEIDI